MEHERAVRVHGSERAWMDAACEYVDSISRYDALCRASMSFLVGVTIIGWYLLAVQKLTFVFIVDFCGLQL